ncbi:hypothetical protein LTR53_017335, partial [Teratosphaeriaceae sp. CCFEE 6253]
MGADWSQRPASQRADERHESRGNRLNEDLMSTPTESQTPYRSPSELVLPLTRSHQQVAEPHVITNEQDCRVFAFYVESVAHWMDIGSPERYFENYVAQLALKEPLVLHACMSCASHIMYLMGLIEKEAEEDYSARVLSLLIPLLSSEIATSQNEGLLATTVILRMAEQFSDIRADYQHHLNGAASLFMDGTDWSATESNLATTCFWTSMRETLRIWFLCERPSDFEVDHLSLAEDDMSTDTSSEEAWTNRMTHLLAQVCKVCWTAERGDEVERVTRLRNRMSTWKTNLPATFRPWSFVERGDRPFPGIRCLSPWHVVAWQFYYTANVMLGIYFPERQTRTPSDMQRYME